MLFLFVFCNLPSESIQKIIIWKKYGFTYKSPKSSENSTWTWEIFAFARMSLSRLQSQNHAEHFWALGCDNGKSYIVMRLCLVQKFARENRMDFPSARLRMTLMVHAIGRWPWASVDAYLYETIYRQRKAKDYSHVYSHICIWNRV